MIFQKPLKKEYARGKFIICLIPGGQDLLKTIEWYCEVSNVLTAVFTVSGVLSSATFGFYDHNQHVYATKNSDHPLEIITCSGDVTVKEGKPFVTARFLATDEKGQTCAGRLFSETPALNCELHLQELLGEKIERINDPVTGMTIWNSDQ